MSDSRDLPPPTGPAQQPPPDPAQQPPPDPVQQPPPDGPVELPPPSGAPHALEPPAGLATGEEWQRLSLRMLAIHPVRTLASLAVPLLVAVFGFGQGDRGFASSATFAVGAGVLVLVFGFIPYFTTAYRLTSAQIQVRKGLFTKTVLTASLGRVRSVDLEASVLHRVLGLSKVKIGTGVDDTRIELDSLTVAQAHDLQEFLRARGAAATTPAADEGDRAGDQADGRPSGAGSGSDREEVELARIDWSWLRFAPFSLSSLVIVAGVGGLFSQLGGDLPLQDLAQVQDVGDWVAAQAVVVIVLALAVAVLVGWLILSTLNYVVAWWNLRLTRRPEGTLRLQRGLFTTRSTTVEEAKVRGVVLGEPFLLRWVRGAELSAMSTGVGSEGMTKVLPPCPKTVAVDVGHDILGETGALTQRLRRHGPRARRRLIVSDQIGDLVLLVTLVVATLFFDWWWWIPPAVWAASAALSLLVSVLAYRNLGHGLTDTAVVSSHGALSRRREVLERAGIIGWVLSQSWWQRRIGLATLVATTAAGSKSVTINHISYADALVLAQSATPEVFADVV